MKTITKQFILAVIAMSLSITSGNCGSAKIAGQREISTTPTNKPTVVYVADFGFGKGKTDLQVVVDIADLAHGAPKDFYELNTTAHSGKLPGAGPMIVLCPAGAAARFVIAGKDLNRNVKQTAAKVAAEVIARTSSSPQQKT